MTKPKSHKPKYRHHALLHDDHHSSGFCSHCGASAPVRGRCGLCSLDATMGLVDGTDRPQSWGHHFGVDLFCDGCGMHYAEHQSRPLMCRAAMERAGPMAWTCVTRRVA